MRVLVLGGTRFIGPPAVQRLVAAGDEVVCFHRGQSDDPRLAAVRRIQGDRAALEDHRDAVLAFAPEVILDMRPLERADTERVLELCAGVARRLVSISSGDVYRAFGRVNGLEEGEAEPGPIAEAGPLRTGRFPYRGIAPGLDNYEKIHVEEATMAADGVGGIEGVVLRLPMVYGPGDYQHRLFPWVKRADDGRTRVPMGAAFADWRMSRAFVDDVALAIELGCRHERARGIYNVAEPDALSMAAWAASAGVTAVPVDRDRCPAHLEGTDCDAQHVEMDSTKIRRELGYAERGPRTDAIAATIAWERANPPAIDPAQYDYAEEDRLLADASPDAD
jgi:nucleoside-diphosphate-sugar epimerase